MKISRGTRVTLSCRVTDDDGTTLTPLASIPDRQPFSYVHGDGQALMPALQTALQGLTAGERARIEIPPENAYGPHRPELVFEAVRENLPEGVVLMPGQPLYTQSEYGVFNLRVLHLTERGAMLDGNHPLAGKTLRFEVEILAVEPAAAQDGGPA